MPENFITRRAILADVAGIIQIEKQSFGGDSFSERQFRYLITRAKGGVYVVLEKEIVIAYICLLIHSGRSNLRIYSVAVHPDYRGQHLGQHLVDKAIERAKGEGLTSVTLEVKVSNPAAIRLYQKNGFRNISVIAQYYHDGSDAYYMRRATEGVL